MKANPKILGLPITPFDSYEGALNAISVLSEKQEPVYVTVNNVHTVVEASINRDYRNAITQSAIALADGKPLSVYLNFRRRVISSRIFGPTLFEIILSGRSVQNLSHFFFGSSDDDLKEMLLVIKKRFPHLKIAGSLSPPFKEKFSEEENAKFLKVMNESHADLFWIGLGAPKQELWMYENYTKLNRGVMIGIGAGFNYLSGKTKHAPGWMKEYALEWLYRLIQEPGRLWRRYLVTNTLFLWFVFLEFTGLKKFD